MSKLYVVLTIAWTLNISACVPQEKRAHAPRVSEEEEEEGLAKKRSKDKQKKKKSKKSRKTDDDDDKTMSKEPDSFTLAWAPGDDQIYEYEVHVGPSETDLTLDKTLRHSMNPADDEEVFDIKAPEVTYMIEDIDLDKSGEFCLQVVAVSILGKSEPSEVKCINSPKMPAK